MRYLEPKVKISRKLGIDLGWKTVGSKAHMRLLKKLNIPPGQHGLKRKKITEYGLQLKEKQKLRFLFNINNRQLKKYFEEASRKKGNTALYLTRLLQRRLDNVVYRLGFAPTIAFARQLVSHRHIKVNDQVCSIPSYQVKINDVISFSNEKILKNPVISKLLENREVIIPQWLERVGNQGKVVFEPDSKEIENLINLRLVIEFFSR